MFNALFCEFLKVKRSKLVILVIILAVLLPIPNLFIANNYNGTVAVDDVFFNNITMSMLLVCSVFFSLIAGYIYSREYTDRTINNLFTSPIKRVYFYISKLVVVLSLILVFFLLSFIFIITVGLLMKHKSISIDFVEYIFEAYMLAALVSLALAPIFAMTAIVFKNVIPPIITGILVMIITMAVQSSNYLHDYIDKIPFTVPLAVVQRFLQTPNSSNINVHYCIMILLITFVVFSLLDIVYYIKSDVHSG